MKVFIIKRTSLFLVLVVLFFSIVGVTLTKKFYDISVDQFRDSDNTLIIIDPGHGGIDGGSSHNNVLEKDINLDISIKLKNVLELKGYQVIMTREEDISLEQYSPSGKSRHQRDLNARVHMINKSEARLFLSIHGNISQNKTTDGSIVFYNKRYSQNKPLALSIQRALNDVFYNQENRTVHDPKPGDYYLTDHAKIPGAIIETGFLSNAKELENLKEDAFREAIAIAIAKGVDAYVHQRHQVIQTAQTLKIRESLKGLLGWIQHDPDGKKKSDSGNIDYKETPATEGMLAIVIDDFGQAREGVQEMMAINTHLTFAVMPFLEFSESDAITAYEKGYEVIVHLPMEPNKGKLSWLGPNPILADMSAEDVRKIVEDAFDSVPHAAGANNHMGSKASSRVHIMSVILDVIKDKNLYFLDSRTAEQPIGKKIADEKGVLCFDRDVFLDGTQSKSVIKNNLREAAKISLKKGKAVAIGHVGVEGGKVTAQAISEMLEEFEQNGVRLVFLSELKE